MINLLPVEYKKIAKKESLRRFIGIFGFGFLILVVVEIFFSLTLFFLVNSSLENFKRQAVFSEEMARLKKLDELEVKVNDLNHLTALYRRGEENLQIISDDVSSVLDILPLSIEINSFLFEKEQLSISGHSDTRNDLLSFVEELRAIPSFGKVDSPVSNLLAEDDVKFFLAIKLIQ